MTQAEQLPGTDSTKLKFVGIRYQTLSKDFKLGDEHEFVVRGQVTMAGEEKLKDGHTGHVVRLEVSSVRPTSFEEPEDPNQPKLLDDQPGDA